jgi:hypothetical protein
MGPLRGENDAASVGEIVWMCVLAGAGVFIGVLIAS